MSGELAAEEGQIAVCQLITVYSEYLHISGIKLSVVLDVGLKWPPLGLSIKSACLDSVFLKGQASLA